jgi:uncharacterized membrane protein
LPGCAPGEACDQVLNSPYGSVLGFSLTKWSLLFYALVAVTLLISAYAFQLSLAPPLSLALPVVTFAGVTAGVWCLSVMVFALQQVCYYCTALHLVNAALFLLALMYARQDWRLRQQHREQAGVPPLPSTPVAIHVLLAVMIGTTVTLAMSVFHADVPLQDEVIARQGNVLGVREMPTSPLDVLAIDAPGDSNGRLSDGSGSAAAAVAPIWSIEGPLEAPYRMVVFSCPTCPKCAGLDRVLRNLRVRYPGQLRVDVRFWPLWHTCNDAITKGGVAERHRDSCELVRCALAVAQVDPGAFPDYLEWMYAQGANLNEALAHAEALARVDGQAFEKALDSVQLWQRFADDLRLGRRFQVNSVPQMFLARGQVFGGITAANLEQLLTTEYGLEPAEGTMPAESKEIWVAPSLLEEKARAANALARRGRYAEASDAYSAVLQLKGDWPEVAVRYAWLLATCKQAAVRDGQRAVYYAGLARQAAEDQATTPEGKARYRRLRPVILDALAAANAEAGDFETAQETARKAVDLFLSEQRKDEADRANERLEMYQRHEPYRE